MYRIVDGKVCGVLTDFDLSSWTADLKNDYTKTSQQRTGTPPFMAYELLDESDVIHLYRHDLESLFYIMLILATHYDIQPPTEEEDGGLRMRQSYNELPYEIWFGQPSYETLSALKHAFFSKRRSLDLSPDFEDFRDWLEDLRLSFRLGINAKETHEIYSTALRQRQGDRSGVAPEFDDETLGGHVNYSALIDPVCRLNGELEGLIIRYDPSISAPTAHVDSNG